MALSRYASPDPYTLEELRRNYEGADSRGRIRLLRRLGREVGIPAALVTLAVKDGNAQVRQWIAHFGDLYGEQEELLRADQDEFVRACVRENPSQHHFGAPGAWLKDFGNAGHPERLAIVRNPHVDDELIEKIFDPDNQEFNLEMGERGELACAFLTNEPALNHGQISYTDWCSRVTPDDASGFLDVQRSARKHFDRLWALASKWPAANIESGVRYWVYRYVGADDKTKAETYRACQRPALRRAILRNTRPRVDPHGSSLHEDPSASEVTKLGLRDDDPECRRLAVERAVPRPENKKLKYASYGSSILWNAVLNAVTIALAYKILSSAATSFETIVSSILVLIYGGINWMSSSHGIAVWEQAVIAARRHLRIIELLKDPLWTEESKETLDEPLRKKEADVRKNVVLLIIQSIWSMALAAIALYFLIRTLF